MSIFVVVADDFKEFSQTCGALAFSEACERLRAGQFTADDIFVPGQGLSGNEKVSLEATAYLSGTTRSLALWRDWDTPVSAPHAITHKRRPENTLISTPAKETPNLYRSHLIVSAQNELLRDHVTGQHIQGMVLVEACRQMFIAVSELSHMGCAGDRRTYVVFNELSAKFLAFTFPVPAYVEYLLLDQNEARTDRTGISAELSVWQNGVKTTEVHVAYTLFEPAKLQPKEIAKGIAAVRGHAEIVAKSFEIESLVG